MSILPAICLAVASVLAAAEPHVVAIGGPRLVIDAGVVLPGSVTTVAVEVRNPAASARTWSTPRMSCACAAVVPASESFPAGTGGTVTMQVRWPLGHAPAEATAEMQFRLPDAAAKPEVATVTVAGRIEDYLLLDERAGTYRLANRPYDGAADAGWAIDLTRGRHPDPWDELSVEVGEPGLTASAERIDADRWRVRLVPTAGMPLGSFGSPLILGFRRGGAALDHRVQRRVVGRISGPVRAVPGEVLLGAVRAGASVERSVRIVAADGGPVTVIEAAADAAAVVASVSPDDPALVILRASAPAGLVDQAPIAGHLRVVARSAAGTFPLRVLLVGALVKAPTEPP